MLIRSQQLKKRRLLLKYLADKNEQKPYGYWMLITYKNGYTFLTHSANKIIFTKSELKRLHSRYLNPSTDKFFNLFVELIIFYHIRYERNGKGNTGVMSKLPRL